MSGQIVSLNQPWAIRAPRTSREPAAGDSDAAEQAHELLLRVLLAGQGDETDEQLVQTAPQEGAQLVEDRRVVATDDDLVEQRVAERAVLADRKTRLGKHVGVEGEAA